MVWQKRIILLQGVTIKKYNITNGIKQNGKIEYVEMYIYFKKEYDTIKHKLLLLYLNYFRLYLHIIENITYITMKWKITLIYEFRDFGNIKISNVIIQWDIL